MLARPGHAPQADAPNRTHRTIAGTVRRMIDRPDDTPAPRDADELTDAVSELGATDTDRLEAVEEHNASLEERLPDGSDLPRTREDPETHGTPGQG